MSGADVQTARAIVPHLPSVPPIGIDARLIDRGMGSWEGTVRRYYIPEPDDAETWEQWVNHASVLSRAHTRVAGRTRAWMQDLLEGLARSTRQAKGGDAAAITRKTMLVSHDAIIVALLNQLPPPAPSRPASTWASPWRCTTASRMVVSPR